MKRFYLTTLILTLVANSAGTAQLVYFADENLKAAVKESLGIEYDPRVPDMLELQRLNVWPGRGITDVTGLEYATNLTSLGLCDNQISDISPLAGLTLLDDLWLFDNQIGDITPLANLMNLRVLVLRNNQISNVEVLANKTKLMNLDLGSNQVSDLSALAGLSNLESLNLPGNQIGSIEPLAALTKLTWLNLASNQVTDISIVAGLSALKTLNLHGDAVTDITPVSNLTSLEFLDLGGNGVASILPLSGLTNLTWLGLGSNGLSDISLIANLINLNTLNLYHNRIRDISPLAELTNLTWIDLRANPLGEDAHLWIIPSILENNPEIELLYNAAQWRTLTVSATEGGSVLTPGEGQFQFLNRDVVLIDAAVSDAAYEFSHWSGSAVDAGKVSDPNATKTTLSVDADYALEAVFVERELGPALGFSLGEVGADDPNEFSSRIATNNTPIATFIKRVTGVEPDPNGLVRMQMIAGMSARAKSRFGRCNAERVLVQFNYLFETPGAAEIVVYLSDVPEMLAPDDPQRAGHYVEIGRVASPPPGRPGAFGSGSFGTFRTWAWVNGLDLSDGLWIELELIRPGLQGFAASEPSDCSVLWDNLETQVLCFGACLNVTWEGEIVNWEDVATVMAWFGATSELDDAGLGGRCLEGMFSDDGYIDTFDMHAWLWAYADISRAGQWPLCRQPLPLDGRDQMAASSALLAKASSRSELLATASSQWPQQLLILGKPGWTVLYPQVEDYTLRMFDETLVESIPYDVSGLPDTCNIRVVSDPDGQVYLVNSEQGVLQLWDATATPVIDPGMAAYSADPRYGQDAVVYIGIQEQGSSSFGRPVLDVAFDAAGYAYVAPVVVEPQQPDHPSYLAAAKLQLGAASTSWELVQLFDDPPLPGDNQRRNYVREIEVDAAGNVYVLNVHEENWSSILWQYASDGTLLSRTALNGPETPVDVVDPLALHVSADDATIYLASGQGGPEVEYCEVYGLSTLDFSLARTIGISGMELVTDITEDATSGTLWISGFRKTISDVVGMPTVSYVPYVAMVSAGETTAQAVDLTSQGSPGLTLPISILWTGVTQ